MSENKAKVEIRAATQADRELFLTLWKPFCHEQWEAGGPNLPSDHNFRLWLNLFEGYTQGSMFGGCFFAHEEGVPVGVLMGGEMPPNGLALETKYGKVATIWGVYTIPACRKRGISRALGIYAAAEAATMGFDTMVTDVQRGNPASENNAYNHPGMTQAATIILVELRKS